MLAGEDDSELELRKVMQLAPGLIAVVHDGCVLFVSDVGAELLGRRADELSGAWVPGLVRSDDRAALDRCLSAAGEVSTTLRWEHAAGGHVTLEMRCLPFFFEGRGCRLLVGRPAQLARPPSPELSQFAHLAASGLMLEGVVNGINNPLASVMANLDELCEQLRHLPSNDAQAEALRIAEEARQSGALVARAAQHLGALRPSEPPAVLDPNDVVRATVELARARVEGRARVEPQYGETGQVEVRDARLVQALLSLIGQRVEAMPTGRDVAQNVVRVRTYSEGPRACIEVLDNAAEPRESMIEQLLTAGRDGGPVHDETQQQLALVRGVVQQLGGRVRAEAFVGGGARFVIELPMGHQQASLERAAELAGKRDSAPPPGQLRILVVDDEPGIQRALERSLKGVGVVQSVSSGNAAIELLRGGAKFDVVLADLVMPSGTGLELADWLDRHEPALKRRMILMTGMGDGDNAAHPDVITVGKPFDIPTLRELVGSVATRA